MSLHVFCYLPRNGELGVHARVRKPPTHYCILGIGKHPLGGYQLSTSWIGCSFDLRRDHVVANTRILSRSHNGVDERLRMGLGKSALLRRAWICCLGHPNNSATSAVPPMLFMSISTPCGGSVYMLHNTVRYQL